jgi:hypothetical protein
MHLNFVIEENGTISLAHVFQTPRCTAVALTADGRVLADDEFYIMPSDDDEFLCRRPDVIEADGFKADVLRCLKNAVAEPGWMHRCDVEVGAYLED